MGKVLGRSASSGWVVDVDKRSIALAAIETENRIIERMILGGLVIVTMAIAAYIRWEVLGVPGDRANRRNVAGASGNPLGRAGS